MSASPLPADFYARDTVLVARELLGQRLVRSLNGVRVAGLISETEAYHGEQDLASHARKGLTNRNQAMYGRPGLAYVYFIYGMHWCLNTVCGSEGVPYAVLIRALIPTEGLEEIVARRSRARPAHWTDGPAKLCQALAITGAFNGADLTDPSSGLWIEASPPVPDEQVRTGPRVGIDYAPEPWRSQPWRFIYRPT